MLPRPQVQPPTLWFPSTIRPPTDRYVMSTVSGNAHVYGGDRVRGYKVSGGRSIIVHGSSQTLTDGSDWTLASLGEYRRALYVEKQTGVAYVAGQYGRGSALSEGIQVNIPGEFRAVHNRFDRLYVRDHTGYTDNHPDLIQVMRADKGVTIEWLCGVTDMQGVMVKHEPGMGAAPFPFFRLRNCLFHGGDYGQWLLNIVDQTTPLELNNICVMPSKAKIAQYGDPVAAARHSITPYPVSQTKLANGRVRFSLPSTVTHKTVLGDGVYYDPSLAGLTPQRCLERWLPASQLGINYTG